jgi:hypothetical protein
MRHAEALIARRVADARAHAEAGRLLPAAERLTELGTALADHVQNARGRFYRDAFRDLDPAIHRYGIHPDEAGEEVARNAPIAGHEIHHLAGPNAAAQSDLSRIAGAGPAFFAAWEARHAGAITRHMHGHLSDAQIALWNTIRHGRLAREELR